MDLIRIVLARCAALFARRRLDVDIEDELGAHIDLAIAENVGRGMSPEAARALALSALGGLTQTREAYRLQGGMPRVGQIWRDVGYALRQLRRTPGFTLTALLTLALSIGAVTSVFSVVDAVLLKPFAFRDPGRLIVLREVEDEIVRQISSIPVNYRHYLRLRHDAKSLEDAAIFQQPGLSVSPSGERPHIVGAVKASPNFFRVLGVEPFLGRDFVATDAVKDKTDVVILSYAGWQTLFQGDPKVIGKTIRIGGDPSTVIGVLPAGVRFPHVAIASNIPSGGAREILMFEPMAPNDYDLKTDTGGYNYNVIARLRPGFTLAQASAELDTLQHAYSNSAHLPTHLGIALTPFAYDVTASIRQALWLLLAAVGGVLLIACVNLANLQLARAVASERETAVRAALGAGKSQLVLNRLAESLVLAIVGGAAGTAFAYLGVRLLITLVPDNVPRLGEVQVNLPVLLFATGISIAAALSFGILPALRSLRVHPQSALQANTSRAANTPEGRRTRSVFVGVQVACTVVLLIVTSLVLRSFSNLLNQNRGFDSSHITLGVADLYAPQYGDKVPNVAAIKQAFANRALSGLAQLPGVQSVALTSATPLTGETWVDDLTRPDHPVPLAERPLINVRWINPDYLPTMQIPLIAGRNFTAADRSDPHVVLLSERAAREGFPNEDPIGKKISDIVPDDSHYLTVIGVVADTRINGLKNSAAMVYAPYWAYTPWSIAFLVRSAQSGGTLTSEIRRVLWGIDPQIAIPTLKSMDDQVLESVAAERFQAVLLSGFGAAALLLALLGVYGVLAYSVSLRQQEFGIRIALGSGKAALMRLVLAQAATPILAGSLCGLALALVALRLVRSLLYQTPVLDPLAIGGSLLLLLLAATLAAVLPARHAASVDPMRALRME
jgi:predicted permease